MPWMSSESGPIQTSSVGGAARQSNNGSQSEWDLEELQPRSPQPEASGLLVYCDCRLLIFKAAGVGGSENSTGCKPPCSYRAFIIFFSLNICSPT